MTKSISHNRERGRASFLEAMSRVASTVSIVTTDGPAGRAALTVSSLVSVSADSPLPTVLVCINKSSAACPVILSNGAFCANVLREDQQHIADIFAGRTGHVGEDRFVAANWAKGTSGAPQLVDPLASLDCRVTHSDLVGAHHVIFAEVQSLCIGSREQPLIYANRAYGTTAPLASKPDVLVAKAA
ncbi:MAG: flavin reductase [Rhodobacteraceae bacterium]|nr:flavin reductase [Paracoccaceae bacterium]